MNKILRILLVIHVLLVATVVGYNSGFNFNNPMVPFIFAGLTTYVFSIALNSLHKFLHYLSLTFSFIYIFLNAVMIYLLIFGLGAGKKSGGELVIVSFFVPGFLLALAYTVQGITALRKTDSTKAA